MSQNIGQKKYLALGLVFAENHGKERGQEVVLATFINYLLQVYVCSTNVDRFVVFLSYNTWGGAAICLRLEENSFYWYKMYILNVLGSKNMYWVLV